MSIEHGRITSVLSSVGEQPQGYLYLTNECNYRCVHCYTDSQPGRTETRLMLPLTAGLIQELGGASWIIFSGGEISFLPYTMDLLRLASGFGHQVKAYTNGSGFLKEARRLPTPNEAVAKLDLESALKDLPSNVEVDLPVTTYHLDNPHPAHRFHRAIIIGASRLAHEWEGRSDRPKIRFIAKDTAGDPDSGKKLIEEFSIAGLGATNANYPGKTFAIGRAVDFQLAEPPHPDEDKPGAKIHINFRGIYDSECSMLRDLVSVKEENRGRIAQLSPTTELDTIVEACTRYFEGLAGR